MLEYFAFSVHAGLFCAGLFCVFCACWIILCFLCMLDYFVFSVHAGLFCIYISHQTLTWTTGSLL